MGRRPGRIRASQPKVDLETLASRQRGLISRAQAFACGLDDQTIRRMIASGRWQRTLPGQYSTFTGELTLEQRRVSAALYLRGRGQMTGVAALAWHGFRHIPEYSEFMMLVIHTTRRTSRDHVRVVRTEQLDDNAVQASGYVVCSVARATADACRYLTDIRQIRSIVAEAVQRKLTTVTALTRELDRAGASRTRLFRKALSEISAGARSAAEVDMQHIMAELTGIRTEWNPRLVLPDGTQLPSPDAYLPDAGMAIEVDSREYHLDPEGWQRTMRRHNVLTQCGLVVLHFTPSEIRSRPTYVKLLIEKTYQERIAGNAAAGLRIVSLPSQ
jgi:hypothetical protein